MNISGIKSNQELFCHKYWKRVLSEDNAEVSQLSKSMSIHGVNEYLIGGYKPMGKESVQSCIATTDKEFKLYKKTDKKIVLYRGIEGPEIFKNSFMNKLLEKCKKLKKGDILRMPEYAYATNEKEYALGYTSDNGILYEISVPKGSRIATDWYFNFPRGSMFLCTQNKVVNEESKKYNHIKLKYLPERPYPNKKASNNSILDKVKTFFNKNK